MNEDPNMKDFVRMGGSYADNSASELFNNFFKSKKYCGDTKYEGDDDYESLVEEWD